LSEPARKRDGLVGLALVAALALPAAAGSPFSSIQDSFVALMPAPPYVETRSVKLPDASSARLRLYRVDEPNTQWLVSATDIAGLGLDSRRTLAGTRDGLVEKSGGSLVSERAVRVARYEGLALRLVRPDRLVIQARLCVTPRRIYEVIVMTGEETRRRAQIERFLDSFAPE
jgi:hypothetical protein